MHGRASRPAARGTPGTAPGPRDADADVVTGP